MTKILKLNEKLEGTLLTLEYLFPYADDALDAYSIIKKSQEDWIKKYKLTTSLEFGTENKLIIKVTI